MRFLISIFLISISTQIMASPAGVKNEDGSFKISDKSLNVMGIKFIKLTGSGPWELPKDALVKIKFTQGVYRKYEGDITYVLVTAIKTDGQKIIIKSDDLETGDEVAVTGVNFLRLTEADLNSETVDNCAH